MSTTEYYHQLNTSINERNLKNDTFHEKEVNRTADKTYNEYSKEDKVTVNEQSFSSTLESPTSKGDHEFDKPDESKIDSSRNDVIVHRPQSKFRTVQKWEGVVESIGKESFIARLYDLNEDLIHEEIEVLFDEITPSDKALIKIGAFFYLSVGYETSEWGQVQKVSRIRFRRVPPLEGDKFDLALDISNQLQREVNWQ